MLEQITRAAFALKPSAHPGRLTPVFHCQKMLVCSWFDKRYQMCAHRKGRDPTEGEKHVHLSGMVSCPLLLALLPDVAESSQNAL